MKKFRTLKHTFFTDGLVSRWPIEVRLLFAGLVCNADDFGSYRLSYFGVMADVFPRDPFSRAEIASMLELLWSAERVFFYESSNEVYLGICNWERHQRIKRRQHTLRNPPASIEKACSLARALELLGLPPSTLNTADRQFVPTLPENDTKVLSVDRPLSCDDDSESEYDSDSDSERTPMRVPVRVASNVPQQGDIGATIVKAINRLWTRRYRWARKKSVIMPAMGYVSPYELIAVVAYIGEYHQGHRQLDSLLRDAASLDMWRSRMQADEFTFDSQGFLTEVMNENV